MCTPFSCGVLRIEEDDDLPRCGYSPPKLSKRNISFGSKNKDNKNPYANRGLETFYALLADLEEKRQKIYKQMGFEHVSLVRFVYSNSNHVTPIVVKAKEKKSSDNQKTIIAISTEKKSPVETSQTTKDVATVKDEKVSNPSDMKCCSVCGRFKLEKLRQPYYYFPLAIVIILVLLAIYGRSFAILCTSIGWYSIPTIKGGGYGDSTFSKAKKKKEYVKKVSDKKIVVTNGEGLSSPRSVLNGPRDKSPRQH